MMTGVMVELRKYEVRSIFLLQYIVLLRTIIIVTPIEMSNFSTCSRSSGALLAPCPSDRRSLDGLVSLNHHLGESCYSKSQRTSTVYMYMHMASWLRAAPFTSYTRPHDRMDYTTPVEAPAAS